jgi:hypothetical protein
MLAGLTVVALPETYRQDVLDRVDAQARAYLPSAAELLTADDDELIDDAPSRWLIPLYVLGGLVAAVVVGVVIGLLLSRGSGGSGTTTAAPTDPGVLPQVTAAPLKPGSPLPTTFPTLSGQPSPTVFIVTPTPSPVPSGGTQTSPSSAPEPATEPLTLTANPTSGPNGATITLQGTGWMPTTTVTIDYIDPLGRPTGSRANAAIDARGRFTTTLSAQDPSNLPGRHTIRATDGTQTTSATYDVSG